LAAGEDIGSPCTRERANANRSESDPDRFRLPPRGYSTGMMRPSSSPVNMSPFTSAMADDFTDTCHASGSWGLFSRACA
jgi:hypothetical protein